jgi:hypothetical protein
MLLGQPRAFTSAASHKVTKQMVEKWVAGRVETNGVGGRNGKGARFSRKDQRGNRRQETDANSAATSQMTRIHHERCISIVPTITMQCARCTEYYANLHGAVSLCRSVTTRPRSSW